MPCCDEDFVLPVFFFEIPLLYSATCPFYFYRVRKPQFRCCATLSTALLSPSRLQSGGNGLGQEGRKEVLSQRRAIHGTLDEISETWRFVIRYFLSCESTWTRDTCALTEKGLGTRGGSDKRRSRTESSASTYHICVPFSTVVESQSPFADFLSSLPPTTDLVCGVFIRHPMHSKDKLFIA